MSREVLSRQSISAYWEEAALPRLSSLPHVVSTRDAHLLAETNDRINDEVRTLHKVIAAFRRHQNMLSPIGRLPNELLIRIFSLCVEPCEGLPSRSTAHSSWINVSEVCKLWYDVAYHSPELWTNLDLAWGERWTQKTYERAHSSPISVLFYASIRPLTTVQFDLVEQHLGHTRALILRDHPSNARAPTAVSQAFVHRLIHPMPLLEHLELRSSILDGYITLPDALFANYVPKLRRVRLNGVVNFPLTPSIVKNIVELSVSNDIDIEPLVPAPFPSLSVFLNAVRAMENIQELHLIHSLPRRDIRPSTPIILKHLKTIELRGDVDDCAAVMENLRFSPFATLALSMLCQGTTDATFIFRLLSDRFDNNNGAFREVEISRDWCGLSIRAWRGTQETGDGKAAVADLALDFHFPPEQRTTQIDVLRSFVRILRTVMASVEILHIQWVDLSCEDWLDLFDLAPAIRIISIEGYGGRALCEALAMEAPGDGGTRVFSCPGLNALHLYECTSGRGSNEWIPLVACLKARALGGAQLEQLDLSTCDLWSGAECELEAIVPCVTF